MTLLFFLLSDSNLYQRTEANNSVHGKSHVHITFSFTHPPPPAPLNHKLAEKYYRARFDELRELIVAEENQFKFVFQTW
jgi:hypothetical protein